MINDRNDISQALAGSGTRRQHIAAAPGSDPDRLLLMLVKAQLAAPNIGLRLVLAENVASRPMEDTVVYQTGNRATQLERRVQPDPCMRPKHLQLVIYEPLDTAIPALHETRRVLTVSLDQATTQFEHVHQGRHTVS